MRLTSAVVLTLLLASPGLAAAGTCSVSAVSAVMFGGYDVFDPSPVDSTGSITIDCAGITGADTIRIDLDGGAAASFAPRTLVAGPIGLAYNLYLDAARTSVWGDGTGGSSSYGPVQPAEGTTTITIFGRIPTGQDIPAGAYGDTLVVTLQF